MLTIRDWGLDYLDLYFIHFPISIQYVDPKVKWPVDWTDPRDEKVHPIDVPLEATVRLGTYPEHTPLPTDIGPLASPSKSGQSLRSCIKKASPRFVS